MSRRIVGLTEEEHIAVAGHLRGAMQNMRAVMGVVNGKVSARIIDSLIPVLNGADKIGRARRMLDDLWCDSFPDGPPYRKSPYYGQDDK